MRPSKPPERRALLRPVARLQLVQPHLAAARPRMDKAPLAHVDASMRGDASSAAKHQVAAAQLAAGNGLAPSAQLRHGARRCPAYAVAVDVADQSAAIEAR